MQIGILGYGQMGRQVEKAAQSRGHRVAAIIDPHSSNEAVTASELTSASLPLDVIIDFTVPQQVPSNVKRCADLGLAVVLGTTGWYDQTDKIKEVVEKSGIGLIWSGNLSLGVNLFFHLIKMSGEMMNRFEQYDVAVHEDHHRLKVDSPSGTAEMLGSILLDTLERKSSTVTGNLEGRIKESDLHISSTRVGSVTGTHRVTFDSEVDSIVLEHSARSRAGFAEGAVQAAEWISGRRGFYNIDDMMQSIIGGKENG